MLKISEFDISNTYLLKSFTWIVRLNWSASAYYNILTKKIDWLLLVIMFSLHKNGFSHEKCYCKPKVRALSCNSCGFLIKTAWISFYFQDVSNSNFLTGVFSPNHNISNIYLLSLKNSFRWFSILNE